MFIASDQECVESVWLLTDVDLYHLAQLEFVLFPHYNISLPLSLFSPFSILFILEGS